MISLIAYRVYLALPVRFKLLLVFILLGAPLFYNRVLVGCRSRWGFILFPWGYASVFKVLSFRAYRVLDRFLAGSRFLDVGAGVGDSCLYALRLGASSVLAVEPDPTVARLLKFNLAVNGFKRFRVVEACAGGLCALVDWAHGRVRMFKGPSVRWEDLLSLGFDVVKVDCEGCEWTLRGEHISMAPVWLIEVAGSLERFRARIPPGYAVKIILKGLDSASLTPTHLILVYRRDATRIQGLQRNPSTRAQDS